jgi:hypothetical protein
LPESDHSEDIVASGQNTRVLPIEKTDNSVQVETSNGLQFENISIWNEVDKDVDLSHTKQFGGYTAKNETSNIGTEARKHEVEEISLVDDSVVFQVNRKVTMH